MATGPVLAVAGGCAVLLLAWGCASGRSAGHPATGTLPRDGCLNTNHARSFTPLHERFVYVRGRSMEHFLLTMDRYCLGLPQAAGITLESTFPRVCSGSGAVLIYTHFGQPMTCGILKVEVVRHKEMAEQLVYERTPPRPQER